MKRALLLAVLAALGACGEGGAGRADKPEEIRTVRVVKLGAAGGDRVVEYAGEVRARHETRLAFRVGGKIVERRVEVGSTVRAGQPVARLDPADLALAEASAQAQMASLQAERDLADADLKRYRELRAQSFISQAELERRANALATAEARLAAARAAHRQAANQASYATLVVPEGGVITAIEAEAGQVVAPGQTVVRLAQPREKEVAFAVPEAQRALVERSSALTVALNARPGRLWQGRLRELSPAADPATRTFAARASILKAGDDVELGMSARVVIALGEGAPRLELPLAAIYSRDDRPRVWRVAPAGTVHAVAVTTGGIAGERIVIESGLEAGDIVVVAGAQLLREGQKVRILEEAK